MRYSAPSRKPRPLVVVLALVNSALLVCFPLVARADRGAEIYREQCASCHGADGTGVPDHYEEPLYGDDSIDVLSRLIERTMPEEDPEACEGDDAVAVASYIYHTFYSPAARLRNGVGAAPRVELARLTVPQYLQAVADIIGQFTPSPAEIPTLESEDAAHGGGWYAEYYQSKGMSKADALAVTRVDRRVAFDFGEGSPAEGISADQFAIIWQGSMFAPDTGHYEFRIVTSNGARLYLNNDNVSRRGKLRDDASEAGQSALIDGWVSSGAERELTARVFLIGGRQYPIRLEFFKYLEKTAAIRFEWKPPHGAWSVMDERFLVPQSSKRVFVTETPFPADDRSYGFERGSAVSKEWHEATTTAAIAVAQEIIDRLPLLTGIDEKSEDREAQAKDFVVRFASAAFRRPLTDEETRLYREMPFADAADLDLAIRRAVLMVLKSPYFLYTDLPAVDESGAQFATAARLALALWDSIPDETLWSAAANGQLGSPAEIAQQARRMLEDPRAKYKLRSFFHHWLEIEERDLAKDKAMFPEFDELVVADLRYSLERFIDDVVWSDTSDYRQLLLSNQLILNDRLRSVYAPWSIEPTTTAETSVEEPAAAEENVAAEPDADTADEGEDATTEIKSPVTVPNIDGLVNFQPVEFPADRRAGVLTHPYLLSAFAYHNNTSPIHRGVFLTRNIVGRTLNPPPIAVAFKDDEFSPDLTMREKITQLTRDKACMTCHSVINPLGFTLESFDAVGRWRTVDNNKPVDTKSEYTTESGERLDVASARDVANFAVANDAAKAAFVTQIFHHLVKQHPTAYGPDLDDQLLSQFIENEFNIQKLLVHIATVTAAHERPALEAAADLSAADETHQAHPAKGKSS